MDRTLYESEEDSFDYFNSDLRLLILNILIQGKASGKTVFTLDQFLKGNYWDIKEISEEIRDTNDFGSVEDLVLHQVFYILDTLNLGKIRRVSITNISELTEAVVRDAVESEDKSEDSVQYHASVIDAVYDLKSLKEKELEESVKEGKYDRETRHRIDFPDDRSLKGLEYITAVSAPFIEIEISFIEEAIQEVQGKLMKYIRYFALDEYLETPPLYLKERFPFYTQLQNFYEYINKLAIVDKGINLPFTSLNETGFEVVKILTYLYYNERAVTNWIYKGPSLRVDFLFLPVTLQNLMEGLKDQLDGTDKILKTELRFDEVASRLYVGGQGIRVKKGGEQYNLLKVVFENAEELSKEWFFSEIVEKCDIAKEKITKADEKKYYNAAYQINLKIKGEPLFITHLRSMVVNPQYITMK